MNTIHDDSFELNINSETNVPLKRGIKTHRQSVKMASMVISAPNESNELITNEQRFVGGNRGLARGSSTYVEGRDRKEVGRRFTIITSEIE